MATMALTKTDPGRRRLLLSAMAALVAPLAGSPALAAPARKRLAVVLGGGSARGFAHIGVVKALDAAGIRPDLIVGCSAGSLVGAFWAGGYSGAEMENLALKVRDSEIIDLVSGKTQTGLVAGRSLQNFVNFGLKNQPIERLRTSFAAVATRYPTGELTVFQDGDPGFAVRASCSIPGVFIPASAMGNDYLDGGLVSPIPVATARKLGADLVVAVDVGGPDPSADPGRSLYSIVMRSFEIMSESLRQHEGKSADILIRPDISRIQSTDFSARRTLIALGQHAGQRLAPVISAKLSGQDRPQRRR